MSRYKIGVIGLKGLPAVGGGARAGSAVIQRLADRYEFTVFATSSHASDPAPMPGVRQVILPCLPMRRANLAFYYWASAISCVLKYDFDLVHVHHGMGGYVVPFLQTRAPAVVTFQGHGPGIAQDERMGWFARQVLLLGERMALRFAKQIVTAARTHVPYYESLTSKRVHWIPNGVESVDLGPPSAEVEAHGEYIAFAAGRIIPLKGCHLLLEVMRRRADDLNLLVIGDTRVDPAYAARLEELAAGMRVEFTGLIEDSRRLLDLVRGARVFVFPSLTEAMSNMLLEAVMCGTPLLCSDIPANRSVLGEEDAVFFESGSVDDLADKLEWALGHPEELKQRAVRARQRIEREYAWEPIAAAYDGIYRAAIGDRSRG